MPSSLMRPRAFLCLLIVFAGCVSSGCWDQRPIEDLGIMIGLGADINQQNSNLADFTFGFPLFEETKRSAAKFVTVSAPTFGNAIEIWQASSQRLYAGGKIRLIAIGEEMAKRGLPGFFDYIELAKTDDNALMAVVKGRAQDFYKAQLPETERTATYTATAISTANVQGTGFRTEVYDLLTAYAVPGVDPILPMLELSAGKDVISMIGSALFNDMIMTGQLNLPETQLLLAAQGRAARVSFSPVIGVTGQLYSPQPQIRLIGPHAKLTPKVENGQLTLRVEFYCSYELRNFYGNADMTKPDTTKQLTQDLESNINLALQQLLAKLQAARTDPLGIGKKLRVKNNTTYDDNTFREMWAKAALDIKVDLHYASGGTLIQTELKKP